MKKVIHVEIENDNGQIECYRKEDGFFSALAGLYAVWRLGKGAVVIGEEDEPEENLIS